MGTTSLKRRPLGIRPTVTVAGMDREDLIVEAIHRVPELEDALSLDWIADDETCRRVGWSLVKRIGTTFRVGRRLLELSAPGGYLLPPPEYRMCLATEPTDGEMFTAAMLQPWSIVLWQSGDSPAEWQVGGTVYHPFLPCERRWWRLLYLNRDKKMARTNDGWVKLGRRMHS